MAIDIKCPQCGHKFPIEEAVSEEYKTELREQMINFTRKKEEEYQRKLEEFSRQSQAQQDQFVKRLSEEKRLLQESIEEKTKLALSAEFENRLLVLQEASRESEEKLKEARLKELAYLKKEFTLQVKEEELEITLQRKLQEERLRISEEVRKSEEQKNQARETESLLRMRELEKQLEDQKKMAEEMRRKAEQGSMQLQGEVQELALEELLKAAFPFDLISEVGKGIRGADCVQTVRNHFGQACGTIIYESKRTGSFSPDWIEKLKGDMRSQGADLAVIVTRVMPKDMPCFGLKDGVWICNFAEVRALASVLRDGIIRVYNMAKNHENKGDKMQWLYQYLTSHEFNEQWKAIREGFLSMKQSIQRERDSMERLWKAREKQLEKVLLSAAQIQGSVEGIAGQDSINLRLPEDPIEPDPVVG